MLTVPSRYLATGPSSGTRLRQSTASSRSTILAHNPLRIAQEVTDGLGLGLGLPGGPQLSQGLLMGLTVGLAGFPQGPAYVMDGGHTNAYCTGAGPMGGRLGSGALLRSLSRVQASKGV